MRKTTSASLIVLTLGACVSGVVTKEPGLSTADAPAVSSVPSVEVPATDATAIPEVTESATTEPSAASAAFDDASDASDFTLILGDGSSYTLSDDLKSVYLVFWSEW